MIGFSQVTLAELSNDERRRLLEARCGLCCALKNRYGQFVRICANYEQALYILLCNSLEEALEQRGRGPCAAHPLAPRAYVSSRFTDYAADVSVALSYHASLRSNESGLRAKVFDAALAKAYSRAMINIPEQCDRIQGAYVMLWRLKREPGARPEDVAKVMESLFGELLSWGQDIWEPQMRQLGESLGRLACYAGVAADLEGDFAGKDRVPSVFDTSTGSVRLLVDPIAKDVLAALEKLPLERDRHLLHAALNFGAEQRLEEISALSARRKASSAMSLWPCWKEGRTA